MYHMLFVLKEKKSMYTKQTDACVCINISGRVHKLPLGRETGGPGRGER